MKNKHRLNLSNLSMMINNSVKLQMNMKILIPLIILPRILKKSLQSSVMIIFSRESQLLKVNKDLYLIFKWMYKERQKYFKKAKFSEILIVNLINLIFFLEIFEEFYMVSVNY